MSFRITTLCLAATMLLASSTAAQLITLDGRDRVNVNSSTDLGTFDWATREFVGGTATDSDGTETVLFDNTAGDLTGYVLGTTFDVDVTFLATPLDTAGNSAITAFRVGYVTQNPDPTFTIRLHSGATGLGEVF